MDENDSSKEVLFFNTLVIHCKITLQNTLYYYFTNRINPIPLFDMLIVSTII